RASCAPTDLHVARPEQAHLGAAGRLRLDIARPGYRDIERIGKQSVGVDVARAGDVDLARADLSARNFKITRTRHVEFDARSAELCDLEFARSGDRGFDGIAFDAVGLDRARAGQLDHAEPRHGDHDVDIVMIAKTPAAFLAADRQHRTFDLDL